MKTLLLLLFITITLNEQAQTPAWVWGRDGQSSSESYAEGTCIAADSSDNVFLTGSFDNTVSFGSYALTSQDGAFLVKYDANGNVQWVKGSMGGYTTSASVATDNNGNSYITGFFGSIVSFDSHFLTSMGAENIFLVKYDPSGNALWAISGEGTGDDEGTGVATDEAGNIYITGGFSSPSMQIGSFTFPNSPGNQSIYIVKLDSSGNVLWAKAIEAKGTLKGGEAASHIATDALANVYITGDFENTIFFDSGSLISLGETDIFIAKYDSSGNEKWAERAGGTGWDYGNCLALDVSNNVYLTGYYESSKIIFGSDTLTNTGGSDAMLVKYTPDGNVVWAKNIGSISNTSTTTSWGVACNKSDKVYLSGGFSDTLSFDTIALSLPPGALGPMFIAGYDTAGHALFAISTTAGGWQNSVAVVPSSSGSVSNCIYAGGYFESTYLFLGPDTLLCNAGYENPFVGKLCNEGLAAGFSSSNTAICSQSCIAFYDNSTGAPTAWQWSFPGASPASSSQQNPTNICYTDTGYHNVTLIVSGGSGTDTLQLANYIYVKAIPPTPVISQSGDTLFCSTNLSYTGYQWYSGTTLIPGATDTVYIIPYGGNYNMKVTNNNGCSIAVGINVVGIKEFTVYGLQFTVSPNPVGEKFTVYGLQFTVARIEINNVLGQVCQQSEITNPKSEIDVSSLPSGIYFAQVITENGRWMGKFVKE